MDLRSPADKAIVTSVDTVHLRRGDLLFPDLPTEANFNGDEVWMVTVRVKPANAAPRSNIHFCSTPEDAKKLEERFPVGSEVSTELMWAGIKQHLQKMAREVIDDNLGLFTSAGDQDLYLPWSVLKDAGISNPRGLGPSQEVIDSLGKRRIAELKSKFGENWEATAEFEFCLVNLPHTSPAFVAAACRFNYFVKNDDFSAGYRLRHLEALIYGGGVDGEGAEALRRAARAGGLARSATFDQKRDEILDVMRQMVAGGQSVSRASELAAARGMGTSPEANRKLWQRHAKRLGH